MKIVMINSFAQFAPTCLLASVAAADAPELSAPVYQGAVPAVLADGVVPDSRGTGIFGGVRVIDCGEAGFEDNDRGPWCFLTSDTIDKVKAFYDKAVGPMYPIAGTGPGQSLLGKDKPVQGYAVYAEQAWLEGYGERPCNRHRTIRCRPIRPHAGTAPHQSVFGFQYDHRPGVQAVVVEDEPKESMKDRAKKRPERTERATGQGVTSAAIHGVGRHKREHGNEVNCQVGSGVVFVVGDGPCIFRLTEKNR